MNELLGTKNWKRHYCPCASLTHGRYHELTTSELGRPVILQVETGELIGPYCFDCYLHLSDNGMLTDKPYTLSVFEPSPLDHMPDCAGLGYSTTNLIMQHCTCGAKYRTNG